MNEYYVTVRLERTFHFDYTERWRRSYDLYFLRVLSSITLVCLVLNLPLVLVPLSIITLLAIRRTM